ncbi:hypothetical protein DITRI_Ditri10aG0024200 [Diplodiscus trichospermus]
MPEAELNLVRLLRKLSPLQPSMHKFGRSSAWRLSTPSLRSCMFLLRSMLILASLYEYYSTTFIQHHQNKDA